MEVLKEQYNADKAEEVKCEEITDLVTCAFLVGYCNDMNRQDALKLYQKTIEENVKASEYKNVFRLCQANRFFLVVLSPKDASQYTLLKRQVEENESMKTSVSDMEDATTKALANLNISSMH